MSRFEELIATVETYEALAAENYNRIRSLAEEMRAGLCDYIGAPDGICVHLVPPQGAFEPKAHGDQAFSMPSRGFRPLVPIAFGLAVRVSKQADWMRVTMECRKVGDVFIIQIEDGAEYEFRLPLKDKDPEPFYEHVYSHVLNWFAENIERYKVGDYGTREIGFDFADDIKAQSA
ncbi:hypothetical protein [Hyphomonas chukchiensis]|uniref:Uncharacterized protein n=1 Tax=Hyphomonas chukchiensis TaxID=1280947 RepID=A0A062UU13_9PROT|nr:hypothetical protein [Hyphomonas chukchiensis]KCZ61287.1 hypothetical protein HY30_02795 [Hyphomonas chukchiensis]